MLQSFSVPVRLCLTGFSLKKLSKSLLPKDVFYWDALIKNIRNIKPRLILKPQVEGFWRLKNITFKLPLVALITLYLLGYYPVLGFPPIKQANTQAAEASIQAQVISDSLPSPIQLPHPGYLSTRFSNWHPGVDIATGLGMPIHPITDGTIEDVQYELWGLGHHITISHPGSYKSTYGHMGRIYVKVGDQVSADSIIGEVGLTGQTSGPHTHLEVTKDGKYLNPLTILPPIPDVPSPEDFKPVGPVGGNQPEVKTELHKSLQMDLN